MKPAVNIKRLLRYGQDVDPRDHADTPELQRLFALYDANVAAGACGTCAMTAAMVKHAAEYKRDFDPGPDQCSKRPPDPVGCASRTMR